MFLASPREAASLECIPCYPSAACLPDWLASVEHRATAGGGTVHVPGYMYMNCTQPLSASIEIEADGGWVHVPG